MRILFFCLAISGLLLVGCAPQQLAVISPVLSYDTLEDMNYKTDKIVYLKRFKDYRPRRNTAVLNTSLGGSQVNLLSPGDNSEGYVTFAIRHEFARRGYLVKDYDIWSYDGLSPVIEGDILALNGQTVDKFASVGIEVSVKLNVRYIKGDGRAFEKEITTFKEESFGGAMVHPIGHFGGVFKNAMSQTATKVFEGAKEI